MKEQTNRVEQYTTRNQWIIEAEKWLNNLEDEMVKIIAAEQNIEKRMEKNANSLKDLWYINGTNICIIGIPVAEERERNQENILREKNWKLP